MRKQKPAVKAYWHTRSSSDSERGSAKYLEKEKETDLDPQAKDA